MAFSRVVALFAVCYLAEETVLIRKFGETAVLRDAAFGTPIILGGGVESVFQGLGYAHATDRLWQLFLRYVYSTARLAEFFGAGDDNVNLESDLEMENTMYTPEEILAEFNSTFSDTSKIAYQGFANGLAARVDEVNQNLTLLPYEFKAAGFSTVPTSVFNLQSLLRYSLVTMRGLSQGDYPSSQLSQLDLLAQLQQRTNNLTAAQAIFDDLVTREGLVKLATTIVPDVTTPVPRSAVVTPLIPLKLAAMARKVVSTRERLVGHRRRMGMLTLDGSWAMVVGPARTTTKRAMLQAGPQDPMTFPTTFYEAFLDAPPFQAHYFTEPGCPLNQIYGVFGNWTAGRNRGYLPANDFRFEGTENVQLHHNVTVLVRGADPVVHSVFRSLSGGFVVSEDANGTALTLRSVFIGRELRGLSFLVDLMLVKNLTGLREFLAASLTTNSHVTHSFVGWADNTGNIAAFMNGVWTQLPDDIDRRLPQNISGANLPAPYTFDDIARSPILDVNNPQGFYAGWNTPFNSSFPWFDTRYGGLWRSEWIQDYLIANTPLSFEKFAHIVQHQQLASSLGLGANTDFDPFPKLFQQLFVEIVRASPTPNRMMALKKLENYSGFFVDVLNSTDIKEDYMLANAWLFRVCERVFGNLTSGTSVALPSLNENISLAVPALELETTHRYPQLLHAALTNMAHYDWLSEKNFSQVVVASLDDALVSLGSLPWGKNVRLNLTMDGVGGILGSVGTFPAGQCQSLNLAIELSGCGPSQVVSAVPFGVSGNVQNQSGIEFDPHAKDQFALYTQYAYRPSFARRFQATLLCEQVPSATPPPPLWVIPIAVAVFLALAALFLRWRNEATQVQPENYMEVPAGAR